MDWEVDNFPKHIDPCLALQGAQELARLAEHSQVEVVVIVSDADFARSRQTDANREVAHWNKEKL